MAVQWLRSVRLLRVPLAACCWRGQCNHVLQRMVRNSSLAHCKYFNGRLYYESDPKGQRSITCFRVQKMRSNQDVTLVLVWGRWQKSILFALFNRCMLVGQGITAAARGRLRPLLCIPERLTECLGTWWRSSAPVLMQLRARGHDGKAWCQECCWWAHSSPGHRREAGTQCLGRRRRRALGRQCGSSHCSYATLAITASADPCHEG